MQFVNENNTMHSITTDHPGNVVQYVGNYDGYNHKIADKDNANAILATQEKIGHGTQVVEREAGAQLFGKSKQHIEEIDGKAYIVSEDGKNFYRIRKLTPRECYTLMGFEEKDFEACDVFQSGSTEYHQAGDSIVVTCLMAIFGRLLMPDEEWRKRIADYARSLMRNTDSVVVGGGIEVPEATTKGYAKADDGYSIYTNRPWEKRGVSRKSDTQTLKTSPDIAVVEKDKIYEGLCHLPKGIDGRSIVVAVGMAAERSRQSDSFSVAII